MSEWQTDKHALAYLQRADRLPHRSAGEDALLEQIPPGVRRVLDLGSGDGRLLKLALLGCPDAQGIAVDFSPTMLLRLNEQFESNPRVQVVSHDLDNPLPDLGTFDLVVSSFAIHHLVHLRKRRLYEEIWDLLESGGIFCNLEHVASVSENCHRRFMEAIGIPPEEEDPSNKLLDVQTQLQWLREIGFADVDCYWKWLELALLVGRKVVRAEPRDKTDGPPPSPSNRLIQTAQVVTVRGLSQADADTYLQIRREALTDSPFAFGASISDDRALGSADFLRECLEASDQAILGAFRPGLAGTVGVYRERSVKGAHKAHLWGMYVKPEYRRAGLGRGLVQAAIDFAKTLDGVTHVHLSVSERAPEAARLYQSLGFVTWGVEPAALRVDGVDAAEQHMVLVI